MKSLLLILCLIAPAAAAAEPLDIPTFLAATRQIENPGGWDGRPGPAGEMSDYAITAPVWRQHMPGIPFARARQPHLAHACAVAHVRWLSAQLQRHGYAPTPARVATAWNLGLTATLRREGRSNDHGRRTANLYAAHP